MKRILVISGIIIFGTGCEDKSSETYGYPRLKIEQDSLEVARVIIIDWMSKGHDSAEGVRLLAVIDSLEKSKDSTQLVQ